VSSCCPLYSLPLHLLQTRQVRQWQNDKPVLAEKVWDTLAGAITEIFDTLEEMNNQYRVSAVVCCAMWYLPLGFFGLLYRQILLAWILCESLMAAVVLVVWRFVLISLVVSVGVWRGYSREPWRVQSIVLPLLFAFVV
jgi:hypothetical protein